MSEALKWILENCLFSISDLTLRNDRSRSRDRIDPGGRVEETQGKDFVAPPVPVPRIKVCFSVSFLSVEMVGYSSLVIYFLFAFRHEKENEMQTNFVSNPQNNI